MGHCHPLEANSILTVVLNDVGSCFTAVIHISLIVIAVKIGLLRAYSTGCAYSTRQCGGLHTFRHLLRHILPLRLVEGYRLIVGVTIDRQINTRQ